MAKEICISSTPHETRLAILEDDQLAEIYYERENEYTLAGSVYNGRVTRVLPGMQSAFVDLGLERDAFLYVTDFIELEDQEETDELEKAAASGAGIAPREVRHLRTGERNGARQEERGARPGGRGEARPEAHQERRQPPEEPAETNAGGASEAAAGDAIFEETQDGDATGARRWRGRRRRRGGRGSGTSIEAPREPEPVASAPSQPLAEKDLAPAIQAVEAPATAPSGSHVSPAFVLPGESLSKYGGVPAVETSRSTPEAGVSSRPAHNSKPSTLIEAPLSWDGSGLLPGESISRHRERGAEPPSESRLQAQDSFPAEDVSDTVQHEVVVETEEDLPPSIHEDEAASREYPPEFEEESFAAATGGQRTERDLREEAQVGAGGARVAESDLDFEEIVSAAPPDLEIAGAGPLAPVEPASRTIWDEDDEPSADEEAAADASASHHIDPSGPTRFRLFGFGGKKKKDGTSDAGAAASAAAPPASSYAPGAGLVEEEVIEGEEFEGSPHPRHHKPDLHDHDVYEEETLPSHLRSGDLGEMLQEAHLDHRIQMKFDEKGVEEEDFDTIEEEEPSSEAPAATMAPGREHRVHGGRMQRGRGVRGGRPGLPRRSAQTSNLPIISDLLKPGQEILVQIAKEPIAKKGARITSHIALPGRFLVFMPTVNHVGVSRKIASDEERHRLKRILTHERGETSGGFIVRTAADGASEQELRADLRFLMNLWSDIKQRSDSSKSPALIYHDLSLIERILRDQVSANFSNIWVDTESDYERIVKFLNHFSPSLVRRVKLYTKETPLFEHFGIEDEISKALRSKVWLKSGGSIVINQTEALVAIDINTGKYVGKSARLEDTILKTNLDAVPEIVRQIRLRDLGGIIVIDFIDMDERKNRFKVMAALEEALKNDRAPTKVLQFNDFGLVAITRKRVKQSLERTLSVPCPTCQATGMVKSPATVCNEIYVELRKMRKHLESADVMLRVNPETVKVLKSNGGRWLNEFEELVGKNVLVKSDATLHPEQFDIQG